MAPVLVAIIAVPLVIIGLTVTYQVGDYLDPASGPLGLRVDDSQSVSRAAARRRYVPGQTTDRAQPSFETKAGRGMKQGTLLVATPIAVGVIGLILLVVFSDKGSNNGNSPLY